MNIFKSKLLWLAPIAVILLLVIFSLAFYPAFNPKPKQLPIAVVNNDKGVDIQGNKVNIGKKIEDKLMDSDSDTVKWVKVDKESDIKKGLKDEKYYGVAIFNKDFSKNNPYRNVNLNEGLNMSKPEINREKSQNINEQLKKLRERVGN